MIRGAGLRDADDAVAKEMFTAAIGLCGDCGHDIGVQVLKFDQMILNIRNQFLHFGWRYGDIFVS
jgi:hypothetical protein